MQSQTLRPKDQQMRAGSTLSLGNDGGNFTGTSKLLGGVMILPNQLIHIFDERGKNGCVRLVCKDPEAVGAMFWQYLVRTYDKTAPVAMSNVTVRDRDTNVVAFAVGRRVFLVRFRFKGPIYDSVETISSLKIDDVMPCAWISSINAHHSSDENNYDFIVSVAVENEIKGCKLTGDVIKDVKPNKQLSSVTNMASSGNVIAIICNYDSDVRLTLFDVTFKVCGYLRPVKQMTRQRPIAVIWTGSMWMVLWVGQDTFRVWMVATYKRTGELLNICLPLSAIKDDNDPVGLARFGNTGIVSFKDNSIKMFKF